MRKSRLTEVKEHAQVLSEEKMVVPGFKPGVSNPKVLVSPMHTHYVPWGRPSGEENSHDERAGK
jgi:hypothetical protein